MFVLRKERVWDTPFPATAAMDPEEDRRVALARAGDENACAWLIERYRDRAVRLAAHVLRRPSEAEDVAQEAFLKAFHHLSAFRGDGRFYTWLYPIILRLCLDRKRLARWDTETPSQRAGEELEAADDGRLAEDTLNRLLVGQLMDQLSPPLRAALVLRELEGLEYEEIARVLDIPVGRVRWRLNQARARFRELWIVALQETNHV